MATVTLPQLAWGNPSATRRALLVHGLGSNGALMWRYGVALADEGWYAEAVDKVYDEIAPTPGCCTVLNIGLPGKVCSIICSTLW